MEFYLSIIIAYLAGSVPFGLLSGWMAGKDVREHGSGNIGFTNVLRVCGLKWGIPVLILDILKGFLPAYLYAQYFPEDTTGAVLCAIAPVLGHNFPVWLKFKGGKGVATSAGMMLAIVPQALGIALIMFAATVLVFRYISLGSICASLTLVAAHMYFTAGESFNEAELPRTILAILACLLVIIRHKANVGRLLAGTESKIGAKKDSPDSKEDSK